MKKYFKNIKLLLLLIFMVNNLFSTIRYANYSSGNDATGDGTINNPYKTFYKSYTVAVSNDTIDLAGTFTWTNSDETGDETNTGYTLSKNLFIRGQGPGNTIIQAHSSPNSADRRVFTITNNYIVTFKNLKIMHGKSNSSSYNGSAIGSDYGTSSGVSLTLENVCVSYNSSVNASASVYNEGIFIAKNCTFENNTNTTSTSIALELYVSYPQKQRNIINCTFYNNTSTNASAPTVYVDRTGANILNSTFINNTNGIKIYGMSLNTNETIIANCIIANSTGYDIYSYRNAGSADNSVKVYNSIIETASSSTHIISYTNSLTGDQANLNITTPTTNGGNNLYTPTIPISQNSVAVDAGLSIGTVGNTYSGGAVIIPNNDQRGTIRTSSIDIGAYEYGGIEFPADYLNSQQSISNGNTTAISTTSNGFWLKASSTLAQGNYIVYGNNGISSITSSDLTNTSCDSRTNRIWYLDVTGTVNVTSTLDISVSTGNSVTAATFGNYKLLYRSGTSGDFSVIATGSAIASTDQVTFGSYSFNDGYYAVGTLNGVTSPLPVELKRLTAQNLNGNVILNWSTVTEINNAGFEVEKLIGKRWSKIGYVNGKGTSNIEQNYSFRDVKVLNGRYEYRLKQIDLDGKHEYTRSVQIQVGRSKTRLTLNPNPFNPTTKISYYIPEKTEIEIKLFDILGKEVATIQNKELKEEGEYDVHFNSTNYNLTSGVYFIKLKTNFEVITGKIVLMK